MCLSPDLAILLIDRVLLAVSIDSLFGSNGSLLKVARE